MKALLLSAGFGTRLQPLTDNCPKPLIQINGKTLLQINIEYLQRFEIYDLVVNLHYLAEQIIDIVRLNKGWGSNVTFSVEEEILDTGGAIIKCQDYFQDEERWIVMNADILTNLDLNKLIERDEEDVIATLAVTERKSRRYLIFNSQNYLSGWTNGEETKIVRELDLFLYKAFSGVQIIHRSFLKKNQMKGRFSLVDAYLNLAKDEKISFFDHSSDIFLDVGTVERLKDASEIFKILNSS